MKIYLAGKIARNDWRHSLVQGLESISATGYSSHHRAEFVKPWPILTKVIFGEHDYTGPYFTTGGGHGTNHGDNSHGVGADWVYGHDLKCFPKDDLVAACFDAIKKSDVLFAWLNSRDAFGTFIEIGVARGLGKQIWIAHPTEQMIDDAWFVYECANQVMQAASPELALRYFLPPPQPKSSNGMKAIETTWNGYKFRSRLEARWAVFFDKMGIAYEYEKEGFDLGGKAGWYLPDFWLPGLDLWLEIKPPMETFSSELDKAWDKCYALMKQSGKLVLLSAGSPWPDEYTITDFKPDAEGPHDAVTEAQWAVCRRCTGFAIREHENRFYPVGKHDCKNNERWPLMGEESPALMEAYRAARQERFGT